MTTCDDVGEIETLLRVSVVERVADLESVADTCLVNELEREGVLARVIVRVNLSEITDQDGLDIVDHVSEYDGDIDAEADGTVLLGREADLDSVVVTDDE